MSRNEDQILGHAAESDGIEEYDNPLPDWWLGMFYVSIVWAIVYAVNWHFVAQTSQEQLYEAELAQANVDYPQLNREVGVDMSEESLEAGEVVFTSTCASCHNTNLTGGIGPNLIDATWIHGGTFADITTTITEGVAAKGMPAWGPILGPKKVAAVASYILSKGGSAPATAPASDDAAPPSDETEGDGVAAAPSDDVEAEAPDGKSVFATNCVACHQADMTGGIGPNLVDDTWIHGGELADIRRTITEGVPAKGMITWKGILSDDQIEAVAQYIYDMSHGE